MKHLFWLPAVALVLTASKVTAQQAVQPAYNGRGFPGDPAVLAALNQRLDQANVLRLQSIPLYRKGNFAKALPLLQQTLQLLPGQDDTIQMIANIYIEWKRPKDVLQTLRPIVYPAQTMLSYRGRQIETRMKYVLALLDTGQWEEAATVYENSVRVYQQDENGKPLRWNIPGYSEVLTPQEHTLPNAHFRPDLPDEPGLRAQAHLILGSRPPLDSDVATDEQKGVEYMLAHLQQVFKSDRRSLDAHFLSGILLGHLDRFAEARTEFAQTAKLAPDEAQPEIKAALAKLKAREESKKLYDATHPEEASQTHPAR